MEKLTGSTFFAKNDGEIHFRPNEFSTEWDRPEKFMIDLNPIWLLNSITYGYNSY